MQMQQSMMIDGNWLCSYALSKVRWLERGLLISEENVVQIPEAVQAVEVYNSLLY